MEFKVMEGKNKVSPQTKKNKIKDGDQKYCQTIREKNLLLWRSRAIFNHPLNHPGMKKHLMSLIMIFALTTSYAQLYQPFPSDSTTWREMRRFFFSPLEEKWDYEYSISGDTVISGMSYHKIVHGGTYETYNIAVMYPYLTSGPSAQNEGYKGAFREDLSRHVYFRPAEDTVERLLYDFNLNVGDTLPEMYNNSTATVNIVFSIDSVVVGTQFRKRYNIVCPGSSPTPYVSLIEGMGSTFGLLAQLFPPFEGDNRLLCFKRENISVYSDPMYPYPCELPTSTEEMTGPAVSSLIFPNPTRGTVTVRRKGTRELRLDVIDVLGKTVLSVDEEQEDYQLDPGQLPRGMYYLKITGAGGTPEIRKLILQ
jgi:hypothetical protein